MGLNLPRGEKMLETMNPWRCTATMREELERFCVRRGIRSYSEVMRMAVAKLLTNNPHHDFESHPVPDHLHDSTVWRDSLFDNGNGV
jgi:hypothetical protein